MMSTLNIVVGLQLTAIGVLGGVHVAVETSNAAVMICDLTQEQKLG